jgi:hypothetical protein
MSTGIESRGAENLSKIDALYPFVGSEKIMTIIGVVIWIGWQIWQMKFENNSYEDQTSQLSGETLTKVISEDD